MHVFIRPGQRFLACHTCGGLVFAQREIKMTTTGMTSMDLDWLNRSAADVRLEDLPDDPLQDRGTAPEVP